MKIDSTFVESNILPEFAWFCLAFRAFSKINSSASWPTVGGGGQRGEGKNQTAFLKKYFFREHVESF